MKTTLKVVLLLLIAQSALAQKAVIDSLEKVVARHTRDSVETTALINLASEFLRKDLNKTRTYAYQAIKIGKEIHRPYDVCGGYLYLVTVYQSEGKLDSAAYCLNQIHTLVEQNPSNKKILANYNQSAGLFYKNQGDYKKALSFLLENLKILVEENENRAGLFLNIGNTYSALGDFKNSTQNHLQALALFEKLGNKRGQSFCLTSLGTGFFQTGQFERAKTYFERSLKIKEELNDSRGLITARLGLGDVSKELNQPKLAEQYYAQVIQGAHEMKLLSDEAKGLHQLGLLYKHLGQLSKAKETITQSLKLARQSGDSTLSAKVNSQLIGLRLRENEAKITESSLLNNLNTVINSGDRDGVAIEYSRLATHYAANKQFDKAFFFLQKHQELMDSVEGKAVILQMKQLEEQFKNEKRDQEIALLKKDNELHQLELKRERANVIIITIASLSIIIISFLLVNRYRVKNKAKRILEMERMRNGIARDLHDDIGSTLSSINILSQLALQEKSDGNAHYFQRIHDHSGKIMEKMSDIVWSINPDNDSLEQVLAKMKEFAAEILEPKNIAYSFEEEVDLKSFALNVEKRKNIFLIFKEAINNAAKYSEGSDVKIRIWAAADKIHFSITDNGKGYDIASARNGNGLKNMESRALNILGKLQHSSAPGKGTKIIFEVPIT